jgi:hypothetical protein
MTTQKTISLDLIQSFNPCYNPSNIIDENEILSIKDAYFKYKDKVKDKQDIIWVLCRKDFLTDTQIKHFALFCAKQAVSYIANPDPIITKCIETTEKYLNGTATLDQLLKDKKDAYAAAADAANAYASYAAYAAYAYAAAADASYAAYVAYAYAYAAYAYAAAYAANANAAANAAYAAHAANAANAAYAAAAANAANAAYAAADLKNKVIQDQIDYLINLF